MIRRLKSAIEPLSGTGFPTRAIDHVSSIHPRLQRNVLTVRDAYAHAAITARTLRTNFGSAAGIDPYTIHRVDPGRITHGMRPFDAPKWKLAGRVLDGCWDETIRPFSEVDGYVHFHVYDSFEAHFHDGVPWRETEFYTRLLKEVREGRHWWGCASEDDVEERCEMLDRLYDRIETEGYRLQWDIDRDPLADPLERSRRTKVHRIVEGEIAVNVGRDGELIFYDGRNRLAIAKILDLESIPVVILVRHRRWQRFRESVARNETDPDGLPSRLTDHPDLRGLIPDRSVKSSSP